MPGRSVVPAVFSVILIFLIGWGAPIREVLLVCWFVVPGRGGFAGSLRWSVMCGLFWRSGVPVQQCVYGGRVCLYRGVGLQLQLQLFNLSVNLPAGLVKHLLGVLVVFGWTEKDTRLTISQNAMVHLGPMLLEFTFQPLCLQILHLFMYLVARVITLIVHYHMLMFPHVWSVTFRRLFIAFVAFQLFQLCVGIFPCLLHLQSLIGALVWHTTVSGHHTFAVEHCIVLFPFVLVLVSEMWCLRAFLCSGCCIILVLPDLLLFHAGLLCSPMGRRPCYICKFAPQIS